MLALALAKAEYIIATEVACEAVWLRRILLDMTFEETTPTIIYCEYIWAIVLSKNLVFHGKSKHIELRRHFIRDLVQRREI